MWLKRVLFHVLWWVLVFDIEPVCSEQRPFIPTVIKFVNEVLYMIAC